MPWYLNAFRVGCSALYTCFAVFPTLQILEAEDRYRRGSLWKPAVGTIVEHRLVFNGKVASDVKYSFKVDGKEYTGNRFRSGGIQNVEHLDNPTLLGVGTQLVIYYNPANPNESAIKLQSNRKQEAFLSLAIVLALIFAYRSVRCESILPNTFYHFINANRRAAEMTGLRRARTHAKAKMKYGKETGIIESANNADFFIYNN